ncbi:MAG: sigma-70 family RNA polymerase sigma factor [Myxococcales bacterium]|nr:sigma-70 family RNA polymerase sigma factor [Myxococcales bacterium]
MQQKQNDTSRHRIVFFPDLDRLCETNALWSHDPQDDAEPQQRIFQALHQALEHELTDKQREVIHLYFFEGLSQHEIARRLGITQQVVQKRIFGTQRGQQRIGGAIARLQRALQHLFSAPQNQRCHEIYH